MNRNISESEEGTLERFETNETDPLEYVKTETYPIKRVHEELESSETPSKLYTYKTLVTTDLDESEINDELELYDTDILERPDPDELDLYDIELVDTNEQDDILSTFNSINDSTIYSFEKEEDSSSDWNHSNYETERDDWK